MLSSGKFEGSSATISAANELVLDGGAVGLADGEAVGLAVGIFVTWGEVGLAEGEAVELSVGIFVMGGAVGLSDGHEEGRVDANKVGLNQGTSVDGVLVGLKLANFEGGALGELLAVDSPSSL